MAVKTLWLMQGVPGSGKSFMAEMIAKQTDGVIYSTDALWYDDENNYNFDPELLGEKHKLNQALVAEAMVDGRASIIVDNTNLTTASIEPYVMLATIHDYLIQVVRVSCDPAVAKSRNSIRPEDRRVPDATIDEMRAKMTELTNSLTYRGY
jgi:predicted kinase